MKKLGKGEIGLEEKEGRDCDGLGWAQAFPLKLSYH